MGGMSDALPQTRQLTLRPDLKSYPVCIQGWRNLDLCLESAKVMMMLKWLS